MTFAIDVNAPAATKIVKLWFPYPTSWIGLMKVRTLAVTFQARARECKPRTKVNYFMYPYAEVDGRPLDYCRPKSFRHAIHFREG